MQVKGRCGSLQLLLSVEIKGLSKVQEWFGKRSLEEVPHDHRDPSKEMKWKDYPRVLPLCVSTRRLVDSFTPGVREEEESSTMIPDWEGLRSDLSSRPGLPLPSSQIRKDILWVDRPFRSNSPMGSMFGPSVSEPFTFRDLGLKGWPKVSPTGTSKVSRKREILCILKDWGSWGFNNEGGIKDRTDLLTKKPDCEVDRSGDLQWEKEYFLHPRFRQIVNEGIRVPYFIMVSHKG